MDTKATKNAGVKKRINSRQIRRNIFFACLVILPVIQFCICYIYVNINSFVLAFQDYSIKIGGGGYVVKFAYFNNFKEAFNILVDYRVMFLNSLQLFFWTTIVGLTLALLFSYYIYKKYPMSEVFRVVLFLPKIMSGVIFCLLYKQITNGVYKYVMDALFDMKVQALLYNQDTALGAVLFFTVWIGFGVNVLMFSGSMSGIDESIVESAQLDGANTIQEFIYITVPMIWPTFVSFLTINFAAIFTDQMHLHTFYGTSTGIQNLETFGYYLYVKSSQAELVNSEPTFSVLAAMGLMMTAVMLPLTITLRKCLRKFGPSVD